MFQINFTNLSASNAVKAYYEAEAEEAREPGAASLGRYYAHAAEATWSVIQQGGSAAVYVARQGDIATALDGFNPATGQAISGSVGQVDRRAATDVTVSADKSVSAVRRAAELAGEHDLVRQIDQAFAETMQAVWEHVAELGLVETRQGAQGRNRHSAREIYLASVTHDVSRGADPNLHKHELLINGGLREDGSHGSIDASALVAHNFYLRAIASSEMARRLRAIGLGIEDAGRGKLKVAGVPEEVLAAWSKRRSQLIAVRDKRDAVGKALEDAVESEADANARGATTINAAVPSIGSASTKAKRKAMDYLAVATRGQKDELPDAEGLEQRHRKELKEAETSPEQLLETARKAWLRAAIPEHEPKRKAVEALFEGQSVATLRQVRTAVAEAAAIHGWTIAEIDLAVRDVVGGLIPLGANGRGEMCYSTVEAMDHERSLLRTAYASRGQGTIRRDIVQQAIHDIGIRAKRSINLSAEQRAALLYSASGDAITVMSGVAGAGKTTVMEVLTMAAHAQGMRVTAIAPTRKAASGLHQEAQTDNLSSIQGLAAAIDRRDERVRFGPKDLLIIDEAGMAEMRHASVVACYARSKGAQVVFLGDELQFGSIGAGAPFRLLRQEIGDVRLEEIRRQRVKWQLDASLKMSRGDSAAGLSDYLDHDRVAMAKDRAAGIRSIIGGYAANLAANPSETCAVIAEKHRDVHELNAGIREVRAAADLLTGDEITVRTIHRGGGGLGEMRDLRLRAGDEVIIWKRVPGVDLNNGDVLTLMGHGKGPTQDNPMLTLRVHKNGTIISVPLSELTPPAGPDDPPGKEQAPHLQHAYAMSLYGTQGMTVDRTWIYGNLGLNRAALYVALTRHRLDTQIVFDAAGIGEEIREQGLRATREAIRDYVIQQATRSVEKHCVSDFCADIRAWAETGDFTARSEAAQRTPAGRAAGRMAAAEAEERDLARREMAIGKQLPVHKRPGEAERRQRTEARVQARQVARLAAGDSGRLVALTAGGEIISTPPAAQRTAAEHRTRRKTLGPSVRRGGAEVAFRRACGRERQRVITYNMAVHRRMRAEIDALCAPGGLRRAGWAIGRVSQRAYRAAREAVLRLASAAGLPLAKWARDRAAKEQRTFFAARRDEIHAERSPEIAAIRTRYSAQTLTYVEPIRAEIARDHAAGRHLHPFRLDSQLLAPRAATTGALSEAARTMGRILGGLSEEQIAALHRTNLEAQGELPRIVAAQDYRSALLHERQVEEERVITGITTSFGIPAGDARTRLDAAVSGRRNLSTIENNQLRDAVLRIRALTAQERRLVQALSDGRLHVETAVRAIDPHQAGTAAAQQALAAAIRAPGVRHTSALGGGIYDGRELRADQLLRLMTAHRQAIGPATPPGEAPRGTTADCLDRAIVMLREALEAGKLAVASPIRVVSPTNLADWRLALSTASEIVEKQRAGAGVSGPRPTTSTPHHSTESSIPASGIINKGEPSQTPTRHTLARKPPQNRRGFGIDM